MPRIEVIMTTWNALEYSKKAILSLIKYADMPFNFTVVDNGSEQDTLDFLATIEPTRYMENFRLIVNKENVGIPKAQNSAYIPDADYTCLANNDVIFSRNWLSKMVRIMEEDQSIWMLGTMIPSIFYKHPFVDADLRTVIHQAPTDISVDEELNHYLQYRDYDEFVEKVIECNWNNIIIFDHIPYYIVTCCALINNKIMNNIWGLADEQYTKYGSDDIDQAWRILDAWYKVAITNQVYIHHFRHKSIGSNTNSFDRSKYLLINNIKFFRTWHRQIKEFLDREIERGVNVNEKMSKLDTNKYWFLVWLNHNIWYWNNWWDATALERSIQKLDELEPNGNFLQ